MVNGTRVLFEDIFVKLSNDFEKLEFRSQEKIYKIEF